MKPKYCVGVRGMDKAMGKLLIMVKTLNGAVQTLQPE